MAVYNSRMAVRLAACLLCVAVLTGCSPREVEKDLAITEVHTGWYDVGIVDGMNKLVPSISLKLENVSSEDIASVQPRMQVKN